MGDVRVVEERGWLIMEPGVVMTRQNFGFPCSPSCSVVCARARAEVDTSAGRLSEAKTQRRPRARERVRGGGFICCFVVFVSFFEQGRRRHVEEKMLAKRGEGVKRGGGLRGATA